MSNRPAHEIRLNQIRASIWENSSADRKWYTVTITRVYQDQDEWKSTASFSRDDLPVVAKAAEMAFAWTWNAQSREGGPRVQTCK